MKSTLKNIIRDFNDSYNVIIFDLDDIGYKFHGFFFKFQIWLKVLRVLFHIWSYFFKNCRPLLRLPQGSHTQIYQFIRKKLLRATIYLKRPRNKQIWSKFIILLFFGMFADHTNATGGPHVACGPRVWDLWSTPENFSKILLISFKKI
jgi:hypothetical protein